jgi:hypothetical protein
MDQLDATRCNFNGERMNNISDMIAEARRNGFYGVISLQFKHGEIVLIRREETIVPATIKPTPRETRKNDSVTGHQHDS